MHSDEDPAQPKLLKKMIIIIRKEEEGAETSLVVQYEKANKQVSLAYFLLCLSRIFLICLA